MTIHSDPPSEPADFEILRLRSLALRDELTGLPNRRAFLQQAEEAFAHARAGGPVFSLVLLDLDGLKDINDTFGYQAGNRGLQEFGIALSGAVRAADVVARIGGDEFAVLALHPSPANAHAIVERLGEVARGVIRSLKSDSPAVILSAAVGQGIWTAESRSVDDLFALAEAELLAAKLAAPPAVEAEGAFRPRGRRALGEELRALLGMARQVTTSQGISDLLRRITEQAAALGGAEVAALAMVEDDGPTVRFDEVWRADAWHPHVSERALGEGVLGRTAATGEPELHNTFPEGGHRDAAMVKALALRSLLSVPLRDRHSATFGVLVLGNKRGSQAFVENDIGLAQAFADLAASAIENVRSYNATEEARAYQRALMEQARDAIVVVNPVDGQLLDVNAAMEQISGYHRSDLLRLTVHQLGLEPDHVRTMLDAALQPDPLPMTLTDLIQRKHGTRVPVELSGSYVQTRRGLRLLMIMRDIEERLAAEAEMRRRTEELEAHNTIAGLLTESRSIEEALSRVLPIMAAAAGTDLALVMLADSAGDLKLVTSGGLPPALEAALTMVPKADYERLTGFIERSRRPAVVNDLSSRTGPFWKAVQAEGIGSVAVLPLVANDRALGVLGAGSYAAGSFDDRKSTRLRAFADQIAVWLDSRISLEAAQAGEQDAHVIADLGALLNESRDEGQILARLVEGMAQDLDAGVIVLQRDAAPDRWRVAAAANDAGLWDERALTLLVSAQPWADQAASNESVAERVRPHLFQFRADPSPGDEPLGEIGRSLELNSLILAPMIAGDEFIGIVVATGSGPQPRLTQRHAALVQQIVQHATVAVTNARAYHESQEAREYLQAVMSQAGDGIVIADTADGLIVDANDQFCDWVGAPREQIIGRSPITLVPPHDRPEAERLLANVRAGNTAHLPERRDLLHADGSTFPVEINASVVTAGGRTLIVGLLRDLRGRIEAERQVRFQARVLATMRDAVVALDREGRVVVWNRGADELFGWTEAEMAGAFARDAVTSGGLPYLDDLVRRLAHEPAASGEVPFERKDGSQMWCHVTLTRMEDERGHAIGLIGIIRDVTAEREASAARNHLVRRLTEANDAARQRTAELTTIAEVARVVVTGGGPDTVFAGLAGEILRAGTFDLVTISVYDPERGALCLRQVEHRLPDEPAALLAERGRWIEQERLPLLQRLLKERSPLVMHDGDRAWQSSLVAQRITHEDRLRLVVALPLTYDNNFIGTLILCAREERDLPPSEIRPLQALADQVAAAVHSALEMDRLRAMRRDALLRLAQVCEPHDPDAGGHLSRIQTLTAALCRELNLPAREIEESSLASILHDIGMIDVPAEILEKCGPLTPEERARVRLHPHHGEALIAGPAYFATARAIVRSHHERWDGSGYPDGLVGDAIPLPARIVAVADVYDALVRVRAHRPAWSTADAAAYIVDHAGILFDPEVVAAFERVWRHDLDGTPSPIG